MLLLHIFDCNIIFVCHINMIFILFTYLYIKDLNIIPQCEELYSKIDNKKHILSVKDTDI